jgi:hypothetical protein
VVHFSQLRAGRRPPRHARRALKLAASIAPEDCHSHQEEEGEAMKRIPMPLVLKRAVQCGLLVAGVSSMTGCATPAYSPKERDKMISRTWNYEGRQAVDDWDSFWLLRPPSRLTIWHVR